MNTNIIYNEDCFNTMKNHIDSHSIDIVLTSPPYNMTKRKGGNADTGRYDEYKDWLTEEQYLKFTTDLFNEYSNIVVDNGIVIYNFSYSIENPSLPYKMVAKLEEETDWTLVDTIVWKKKNGMPFPANERRLSRIWEFVFVFARKSEKNTFFTHKGVTKVTSKGQKYYNVYYNMVEAANNDGKCKLNQATFSSELVDKLFRIYADKGMTVYDSFMGTGTTAVTCKKWGINYIGSEISKKQCEYAEERLKNV